MSEAIQSILVGLAILLAAGFIAWQAWRTLAGRKTGCGGGCRGCGAASSDPSTKTKTFVPIEELEDMPRD